MLMAAELFPEVLEQEGDLGGREVVQRHADKMELIPLDDARIGVDIDTPETTRQRLTRMLAIDRLV